MAQFEIAVRFLELFSSAKVAQSKMLCYCVLITSGKSIYTYKRYEHNITFNQLVMHAIYMPLYSTVPEYNPLSFLPANLIAAW